MFTNNKLFSIKQLYALTKWLIICKILGRWGDGMDNDVYYKELCGNLYQKMLEAMTKRRNHIIGKLEKEYESLQWLEENIVGCTLENIRGEGKKEALSWEAVGRVRDIIGEAEQDLVQCTLEASILDGGTNSSKLDVSFEECIQWLKSANPGKTMMVEKKFSEFKEIYVDSFSTDGIVKPIVSIQAFYEFLYFTCSFDAFDVARAIGLAIKYNVEYDRETPDNEITNIDVLKNLDGFINQYGSRIRRTGIDCDSDDNIFAQLMCFLLIGDKITTEGIKKDEIGTLIRAIDVSRICDAMGTNLTFDNRRVKEEEKAFRRILNACYRDGELIALPNCKIVDFEKEVVEFLDPNEANYIIRLLKSRYKKQLIIRYMSPSDRDVYIKAISEKAKLDEEQKSDFDELMQYLNELAVVYKAGISDEDKGEYDKELEDCVGNIELLFHRCGVALRGYGDKNIHK